MEIPVFRFSPTNQSLVILSHQEQRNSMNSGELFGLRGALCSAEPKGWLKNPWGLTKGGALGDGFIKFNQFDHRKLELHGIS